MSEHTQVREDHPEHDPKHDQHDGHGGHDRVVKVTVVAPNNDERPMEVDLHDRVDKVARQAVKMFVAAHQMDPMPCSLAIVIKGVASPLDDTARLSEAGVHQHSRLVLIPKTPKTDG